MFLWIILPSFYLGIEPVVFARLVNVIFSFMLFNLVYYYSTIPFILLAFKNSTYDNRAFHYSNFLKQNLNIKGNIASTSNWGFSLSVAYFLNSKYFGEEKKQYLDTEFLSKLKKSDINYLLHFTKTDTNIDGLNFVTKIDSLYIFKVIK